MKYAVTLDVQIVEHVEVEADTPEEAETLALDRATPDAATVTVSSVEPA